jgi:hypothetical protein
MRGPYVATTPAVPSTVSEIKVHLPASAPGRSTRQARQSNNISTPTNTQIGRRGTCGISTARTASSNEVTCAGTQRLRGCVRRHV